MPTQPSAMKTSAVSHLGASTQARLSTRPSGRADPDDDQDRVGDGAVEGEQRERRVGARDQQQDRRVVEPAHPCPHARRLPVDPVIERADAEHRRQRNGVDPRGDQFPTRIRDRDQDDAGDERDVEGVLVEHTPQTRLRGERPLRKCAYTRRRGPLAQLVEQGTFNPKVVGSIPARPMRPRLRAIRPKRPQTPSRLNPTLRPTAVTLVVGAKWSRKFLCPNNAAARQPLRRAADAWPTRVCQSHLE